MTRLAVHNRNDNPKLAPVNSAKDDLHSSAQANGLSLDKDTMPLAHLTMHRASRIR